MAHIWYLCFQHSEHHTHTTCSLFWILISFLRYNVLLKKRIYVCTSMLWPIAMTANDSPPRYTGRPDYLGLRQDDEGGSRWRMAMAKKDSDLKLKFMEANLMLQELLYICGWVWSWGKYFDDNMIIWQLLYLVWAYCSVGGSLSWSLFIMFSSRAPCVRIKMMINSMIWHQGRLFLWLSCSLFRRNAMAFMRHFVAEKMNALSGRCSQTLGLKSVLNRTLALSSWREETQARFGHEFSSIDCVALLVFGWGFLEIWPSAGELEPVQVDATWICWVKSG